MPATVDMAVDDLGKGRDGPEPGIRLVPGFGVHPVGAAESGLPGADQQSPLIREAFGLRAAVHLALGKKPQFVVRGDAVLSAVVVVEVGNHLLCGNQPLQLFREAGEKALLRVKHVVVSDLFHI